MQMSIKGDSICCKVKVALVNMIHHCDQEYKRDIRELKKNNWFNQCRYIS